MLFFLENDDNTVQKIKDMSYLKGKKNYLWPYEIVS